MQGSIPGPWDHDLRRRQRLSSTEPPRWPIYGLFGVEVCSWSMCSVENFDCKWILKFVRCFPASQDDHIIFILYFLNALYHFDLCAPVKHNCIPETSHLIIVYDHINILVNMGF